MFKSLLVHGLADKKSLTSYKLLLSSDATPFTMKNVLKNQHSCFNSYIILYLFVWGISVQFPVISFEVIELIEL